MAGRFRILICVLFVLRKLVAGAGVGSSDVDDKSSNASLPPNSNSSLMVNYTLVEEAAAAGAVCLDGSVPAYHFDQGFSSGAKSWLIQLEGGGWCNSFRNCNYRVKTHRGSSKLFEKSIPFTGILSNKKEQNPDFFNWNRVKVRYCDGASFSGNREKKVGGLYFRGQRIFQAVMKHLMAKGMCNAEQVLLSGCSAGGLASILHCDRFRKLFSPATKVKCLSDAGLFLDVIDVSGVRTLRRLYEGVVHLQGVGRNLTGSCPNGLSGTSCFFPQNLIANIQTPLFILNAAYDAWQVQESLAPPAADRNHTWNKCRKNITSCSQSQMSFLKGFRTEMVEAVDGFARSGHNGLFLNSCFAHCQSERQDTWFAESSPNIDNKRIAVAVGDWYFERGGSSMAIDCEDCSRTCHNLSFL